MRRLSLPLTLSFFFNAPATTEISTLSLHDALPICAPPARRPPPFPAPCRWRTPSRLSRPGRSRSSACRSRIRRSEEHTSELQSRRDLVCRLLLEKKKCILIAPLPAVPGLFALYRVA